MNKKALLSLRAVIIIILFVVFMGIVLLALKYLKNYLRF